MLKVATSPYARKIYTLDQYTQWQQTYETTLSCEDECIIPPFRTGLWKKNKKSLSEQSCLCPQQHLRHLRSSCSAIGESINNSTRNNNPREEIAYLSSLRYYWCTGPLLPPLRILPHYIWYIFAKQKTSTTRIKPVPSVSGEPEIHHLLTGKSPSQMFQAAIRKTKYVDTFIKLFKLLAWSFFFHGLSFFAPQNWKLNFTACSGVFVSTLLATINIRNAPSTNPSLYWNSSYNFV